MISSRVLRLTAVALFAGGCNLPSAVLLSLSESDGDYPSSSGLDVHFEPGLPLVTAAAAAPAAFSRLRGAAARLALAELSLSEASTILEGELLHKGMLLPLPAGTLTIRTIAPEPSAIALVSGAPELSDVTSVPVRQLPEVIGAYGAGRRTMVLATDGSFRLFGPAEPYENGTFFLVGKELQLVGEEGAKRAFSPTANDSWRDGDGEVYTLLHEAPVYDSKQARKGRGGR